MNFELQACTPGGWKIADDSWHNFPLNRLITVQKGTPVGYRAQVNGHFRLVVHKAINCICCGPAVTRGTGWQSPRFRTTTFVLTCLSPAHFISRKRLRTFAKSDWISEQELIRRWDNERELLRSAPWKLPEFAEITQNNGHYAVQGHSRSPILISIESSYTISY